MNLPNVLTIVRILLTFVFIYFYCQSSLASKVLALIVFTCASVTDYFDGYLARKHQLVTGFGKIMDPIADKFLTLSAFYIFTHWQFLALWMFIAIAAREVIVTGLRLLAVRKGIALAAEGGGKLKTVLQIVLVYLIMIYMILVEINLSTQVAMDRFLSGINGFTWIVVLVTVWSGVTFILNNRKDIFYVG